MDFSPPHSGQVIQVSASSMRSAAASNESQSSTVMPAMIMSVSAPVLCAGVPRHRRRLLPGEGSLSLNCPRLYYDFIRLFKELDLRILTTLYDYATLRQAAGWLRPRGTWRMPSGG